uniref:Uncharacterized protein n=1 Tax=Anguilla anguilla TaxID=7936 RepID=A0A0E9REF0_ANGAN
MRVNYVCSLPHCKLYKIERGTETLFL